MQCDGAEEAGRQGEGELPEGAAVPGVADRHTLQCRDMRTSPYLQGRPVSEHVPEAVGLLCSVMVLKKLGDEQREAFLKVLRFLGQEEDMRVIVEPHEYLKLSDEKDMDFVDTYNHAEGDK